MKKEKHSNNNKLIDKLIKEVIQNKELLESNIKKFSKLGIEINESFKEALEETISIISNLEEDVENKVHKTSKLPSYFQNVVLDKSVELNATIFIDALQKFILDSNDKELIKRVNTTVHKFRSKGILIEKLISPSLKKESKNFLPEDTGCYSSRIDFYGSRVIFYSSPSLFGVDFIYALIDDEKGLIECLYDQISRNEYKSYIENYKQQIDDLLFKIDPSYTKFLLISAIEKTKEKKLPFPEEFKNMSQFISRWEKKEITNPVYSMILYEEIQNCKISYQDIKDILEEELLYDWIPDDEITYTYFLKMEEINESQIIISEIQKRNQLDRVFKEYLEEYFKGDKRLLYKKRLEEIAYLFAIQGKLDIAKIILKSSFQLGDSSINLVDIPFIVALMKRGF